MGGLLALLNPLKGITDALVAAYAAHENAKNDSERLRAEADIEALKARRDVAIAAAASDRWWSPRTIMGWCATAYVFKTVVWDTLLGWGVTPDPGPQVTWFVVTIVGFYFVSRSAEAVANTLAATMGRRNR